MRYHPEYRYSFPGTEKTLRKKQPTTEPVIVGTRVFVVPDGKGDDYIVEINAFAHAPGGILETERATTGHDRSFITLIIPDDPELSAELGLSAVKIDRVLYEAVDASESETQSEK